MEVSSAEELRALLQERDTFGQLADQLRQELHNGWDEATERGLQEALRIFREGDGDITRSELEEVLAALEDVLGSRYARRVQPALDRSIDWTYEAGQRTMRVNVTMGLNRTDRRAMRWLKEHHMYWIETHYDRMTRARIANVGRDVIEEGLGRFEAAQEFRKRMGPEFQKSQSYWELLSNHVTTRSRSFSRAEGFVKAGITEVMIDAVNDRRTSCICEWLDGMVLPVSAVTGQRDELMEAEDPEMVRTVSPWLTCEEITGLGPEELVARGVISPPYHANCRSMLVTAA